ncbi:MAG: L-lactate dehydrogenase [Candidatus Pacebacteria bacterium]|nr:L-lactate dehydrogenase [Candidatus Paceibacterota bacterium]
MMKNKITIIGAGFVGSTAAYSLIAGKIAGEIVLIDKNEKLAKSQAMDLQHSVPFWGYTKVKAGTYEDIKDSKIAIICCGVSQKKGETRMDLIKENWDIVKNVASNIFKQNKDIIILMVTNPVDVLTYLTVKMFPEKKDKIIGTGTILDSARFRFLLGEELKINPQSAHAYIIGEHGDSEVPLWSTATVGNTHIDKFKKLSPHVKEKISDKAKNAAYAIIEGKQATYFAISGGIAQISETILFDKKRVLPLSHYFNGEYGIRDICLSSPIVLGKDGIEAKIEIDISKKEKNLLKISADKIREAANNLR